MSKELKPGDKAPTFTATAVGGTYGWGETIKLSAFKGQTIILYFYPKDDTPGCVRQACALRDAWKDFASRCVVFGISIDSAKSHTKFVTKYSLPFPLISDEDKTIVEAYGVWVEKSMYGRKYMGTERSTFVIGPDGKIKAIFRKVKPEEHTDLILAAVT
ncbi:MAG: thioredoxin-dependent thiol peroxidase [Chthoniobacter sp.]|nr:thioredoxin-dependent thiol peroxidase [Chthoniobacter sp.]